MDDVIVRVLYEDGTSKKVSDYTTNVDTIDMSTEGNKMLEVIYEENNTTVTSTIAITVTTKEEPTTKPSEEPTTKPDEEPTTKLSEEPTTKPSEEPTTKPVKNEISKIKVNGGKAMTVTWKKDTNATGIDRGPEPIKLLNYIRENVNAGAMSMLMGNHEMFAVMNYKGQLEDAIWAKFGGKQTLAELSVMPQKERTELIDFLDNLPYYAEINSAFFGNTILTHRHRFR